MQKALALLFLFCLVSFGFVNAIDNNKTIYIDNVAIKISLNAYTTGVESPSSKIDTIRIPLKKAGNLIIIEAQIDSLIGNFIVDLGAPYLVLNSIYFRDYYIDNDYSSGTLNSENTYVKRTTIDHLSIQGLTYSSISADLTDLGAIENKRDIKMHCTPFMPS